MSSNPFDPKIPHDIAGLLRSLSTPPKPEPENPLSRGLGLGAALSPYSNLGRL
jgi:hypothetical protein